MELRTHCTFLGLDQAMLCVSFKPSLRPFSAPNAAPIREGHRDSLASTNKNLTQSVETKMQFTEKDSTSLHVSTEHIRNSLYC